VASRREKLGGDWKIIMAGARIPGSRDRTYARVEMSEICFI